MIQAMFPSVETKRVYDLNIEDLPRGVLNRLWLVLSHNALGQESAIPVLVMRGERPGPTFGITAALHGNEINGIPVIHKLFSSIDPKKLRGSIAAVPVVNVPGFHMGVRYYSDKVDLNSLMPGLPNGKESQVFAFRFCEKVVKGFDYLVDLHTASFGRVNSLYVRADMDQRITATMAKLQHPEIILHNSPSDSTLRGYAMELGIPAITIEIGNPHRFQPEYIRKSLVGLKAVMAEAGMLAKRPRAEGPAPILCSRSFWMRTQHGGLLEVFPKVTAMVEKDEPVARLTDIFGQLICEYRAPESGVVIGKSVHPVGQTGARILHLGILR